VITIGRVLYESHSYWLLSAAGISFLAISDL
jgi:hypothetical protein